MIFWKKGVKNKNNILVAQNNYRVRKRESESMATLVLPKQKTAVN
jgi:hypothetical protein